MSRESGPALYHSRTIDLFVKLVEKRYPQVDIAELLAGAGMKPYEIADEGHWFTQEQADRFHERMVQATGNSDIAREAGRFAANPDTMGMMKQGVLSFLGPAKTFELIRQTAAEFTRSSIYESRRIGPNSVELTVTALEGIQEKPYQCANRTGTFEAVLAMFNYGLPNIEHPECMFAGGSCCRYLITWESNPAEALRKMRNILALLLVVIVPLCFFLAPAAALSLVLPVSAFVLVLVSLAVEYREKRNLKSILHGLGEPAKKLVEQVNANYNNALITNEVGQAISRQTEIAGIIESVLQVLQNRLGYDRGVILLANPEKSLLLFRAGFGFSEEQNGYLRSADFDLEAPAEAGVFVTCFRERKPLLVSSAAELEKAFSAESRKLAKNLGAESFICCPIICDGESIGILAIDNMQSKKPLLQTDLNLLMGIAPVIGVTLRNAELLETKDRQFNAIKQLEKARDEIAAAKEMSERYAGELQQANEDIRNFAYIVSHDLRAPLVNIKGFSGELRSTIKDVGPLIEKGKAALGDREARLLEEALGQDIPEALEFIESSVNRMDALINAILKLSRLGRRELKTEQIDVDAIIRQIIKTLGHQLEEREVTVTVNQLPEVTSDRTAVEQIVGNLLDNAVKYLDKGRPGQIEISAETTGYETIIHFRDNGRGIAQEDMGKVFEIFRRAGKQDMPGEGMGLAYVKTLVRRLGGRIWCESELGTGTVFSFSLPHRQEEQQ